MLDFSVVDFSVVDFSVVDFSVVLVGFSASLAFFRDSDG